MKRSLVIAGLVALGAVGWYMFRPERLFVNKQVHEDVPQAAGPARESGIAPSALARGSFHSVAHKTRGTATILDLGGGKRILRLTDFSTSNGPDVRVYLVAAPDASDNETVRKAGFVELGVLKGNQGDQNYDVPVSVDLGKYRAVTIWCRRFSVNFATAPLAPGA